MLVNRYDTTDAPDEKPNLTFASMPPEANFLGHHIRLGARVLEVGAAHGDFVAFLQSRGMRASGLEPYRPRVVAGREAGFDMREGRFSREAMAAEFGGERFDLLCLREVIVLLDDFDETFALAREYLAPGGTLYVKMHVAESPYYWPRRVALDERVGDMATAFFDSRTLQMTLRRHGFAARKVQAMPLDARHMTEALGTTLPRPLLAALYHVMPFLPPDRVMILAEPV